MYKDYFKEYIKMEEIKELEETENYNELLGILKRVLGEEIFLDIEEMINFELAQKLEAGYKAGFETGRKVL